MEVTDKLLKGLDMKLNRVLKGYVEFWCGSYYIEFNKSARWNWSHFKIHKRWNSDGFYRHLVWGKLSLSISQPQYEMVTMCSECDGHEPIEVLSAGDESLNVCPNCRTVEGKTHEISELEFDQLN